MTGEVPDNSHSHKGMGGHDISRDEWRLHLATEGLIFEGDAHDEGGLLRSADDPSVVTGWVKPPLFRKSASRGRLQSTDIRPLTTQRRPDPGHVGVNDIQTGAEIELYGYNPETRDMEPIMAPGHPVREALQDRVGEYAETMFGDPDYQEFSSCSELPNSAVELNFIHGADDREVAISMTRNLQLLARIVEDNGALLLPVSTLPHRSMEMSDLTDDEYVRRMALDLMGWDVAQRFTCLTLQDHTENLTPEASLFAANQLQHVSYLINAFMLAAPFTHGELTGLSGRYATRIPSGGVFTEPLPETMSAYWDKAEAQLKSKSIKETSPSPARVGNQHGDRTRLDLPPYGTIEACAYDTAGAEMKRIAAARHMNKILLWKFQHLSVTGKEDRLEQLPELFTPPTRESFAIAHHNNYQVADEGLDALVGGQDGITYVARNLSAKLLQFVDASELDTDGTALFTGMPARIAAELHAAARTPSRELMARFQAQGAVAISGYYATRVGTLGHWTRARYDGLVARGVSHTDAIADCMTSTSRSYHAYINQLQPHNVADLFGPADHVGR